MSKEVGDGKIPLASPWGWNAGARKESGEIDRLLGEIPGRIIFKAIIDSSDIEVMA